MFRFWVEHMQKLNFLYLFDKEVPRSTTIPHRYELEPKFAILAFSFLN
jgi:hypothetical protein